MFARNAWYLAGWSHELDRKPMTRSLLGETVVLYRDAEGVAPTLDLHELGAQLDEEARARLHEIAVDDEPIHGELPVEQVFDDLMRWFDSRRRAAERRVVTRRMSEPAADQATLLSEKQRQLDQRRSALGIDSGTTP